ncbi:MAG: DUF4845 domain-containing protein [Betaproteobacteria bacterium RBG_16_56_24]|nr:MAG: DUF4845 domain-containing protein [Betaproteobacteria bacterium RBG_16_56_24]
MNTVMPVQQRGITFGGFLVGVFLLVIVSIFGLQLIPAYMQDAQIKKAFTTIAHDPEMQKATPREIKNSFEKRASIDNIKAIKSEDIEINMDLGRPVLSASYFVKVPLAGNISLYLDFNPASD